MEVTIGFATAASGTAIEDRGEEKGEQERIPSSRHNVSFIQKVPFKILCAPQWGHWQRERERGRESGPRRGGEGRPTPTEEPGEFFSGAGTKGEHHRLATLSQDGVTDGRTSLWNTSGKTRGVFAPDSVVPTRDREIQRGAAAAVCPKCSLDC